MAVTANDPVVVGLIVTVHVVVGPLPMRVHEPPGVTATFPVGELGLDEVSATAMVHCVDWPREIVEGLQDTVVAVGCV